MKYIFICSCLLFIVIGRSQSLKFSELPVHFNLYQSNPYNTLAFAGSHDVEANILARQNLGNFGNVSTQYFSSFFGLKENNGSRNALGLIIYNDKEGDYLRTNRFYGSFIRHQALTNNWKLSLGLSSGLYLFRVKFNNVTGGISQTAFDGSASLALSNENTEICFTLNQFLNSPINASLSDLKLSPFLVINGEQKVQLNDQTKLIFGGYYKPLTLNSIDLFNIGFSSEIKYQKLGAGIIYDIQNGFSITTKIDQLQISKTHNLDFQIAYFSPFINNLRQRIEVVEVSLSYFLEKN